MDITAKQVTEYQSKQFLRAESDSCSIELLPLPSPSMNDWIYAQHSKLPYLQTRADYRSQFAQQRADIIQQRIRQYKPTVVMFYGLHPEYVYWWKKIANLDFESKQVTTKFTAEFGFNGDTVFVVSRHPVAFGSTNEYWHTLGQQISLYQSQL